MGKRRKLWDKFLIIPEYDYVVLMLMEVRCVDRYLLGHLDDEWFKDESFWRYLLERMAKNRFNRFCLILGFDTAYMSPPYPFFLKSSHYPDIYVKSLSEEGQMENLQALRQIGAMCHEYGMKFILATWQQRPWTVEQEALIENLPEDVHTLSDYCYNGLKDLIRAVPEIDIVQFRVNHESGVGDQISAEAFWNHCTDAVADIAEETGRPLILDLRAKGLTDSMIDHAFERGLAVEVATKYWCEHAALPHHITIMRSEELAQLDNFNHSRRYSYADMLKKPRHYDMIYRLWNYGSTNLFIWGGTDYARRFSESCKLSGSAGFQINTPLSLKYGHEKSHKEAWHTFAKEELRYGKWEDERFWMWYIVFGRLGYNPETKDDVWQREFSSHFGVETGMALEKALASASEIIPLITTVHMPVHPSLRYWTEMSTGWALFYENNLDKPMNYDWQHNITYGTSEPSDHGLFYGIDEYAKDYTAGNMQGKYSPLQYVLWLEKMADDSEEHMKKAASSADYKETPELLAFAADIDMLAIMARYHAEKICAALALALWRETGKHGYLSDSYKKLTAAIVHWTNLAAKGKDCYYHDLNFSSAGSETRRGTWADLTCELEADLQSLSDLMKSNQIQPAEKLYGSYLPGGEAVTGLPDGQDEQDFPGRKNLLNVIGRMFWKEFPKSVPAGKDLCIEITAFEKPEADVILHYRHTDQTEGEFHTLKMTPFERSESDQEILPGGGFKAVIPGEYITAEWDLQIYITSQGPAGTCFMFPGIYHPFYPYPYHVINVAKEL